MYGGGWWPGGWEGSSGYGWWRWLVAGGQVAVAGGQVAGSEQPNDQQEFKQGQAVA